MTDTTCELIVPENEIEARGIAALLEAEGIECSLFPYWDTAYPGVVDRQRAWGVVRVARADLDRAREILTTWQSAQPEDLDTAWQRHASATVSREPKTGFIRNVLFLLTFLIILLTVWKIYQWLSSVVS